MTVTAAILCCRLRAWAWCARPTRSGLTAALVGLLLAGASCAAPHRRFTPTQDPAALDDVSFIHYVATVPAVDLDEASRALLLWVGDESAAADSYLHRRDRLVELRALRADWDLEPGQVLDRGTLAYALVELADLPRSLCSRLSKPTGVGARRYALRTCVREGVLPPGPPYTPVTGGEFVAALTRVSAAGAEEALPPPAPQTPASPAPASE